MARPDWSAARHAAAPSRKTPAPAPRQQSAWHSVGSGIVTDFAGYPQSHLGGARRFERLAGRERLVDAGAGELCQRREIDLIELLDDVLDFVRDQLDFVV